MFKLRFFSFFALVFFTISCSNSGYHSIEDVAHSLGVNGELKVLFSTKVNQGEIALIEREIFKDIAVIFLEKAGKKYTKGAVGGYLSQDMNDSDWHYSSGEIAGKSYSVYYGSLNEKTSGKVLVTFNTLEIEKEATITNASLSTIWFVIFDERTEDHNIRVDIFGD